MGKKVVRNNLYIIMIIMTQSASKSVRDTAEQACFYRPFKTKP